MRKMSPGNDLRETHSAHTRRNPLWKDVIMKRTTALLSLFLTVLLLAGLFPVSVQAADDPFPAEYATLLDESVLETTFAEKTKGLFLSEELSEYAYNAIRYPIRSKTNDYRVAKNLLQLYKSVDGNVIFFFDGCSANLKGSVPVKSGYSYDVKKNRYNMSAVCLVVRADQEGRPYIAYATKDAATMADNVRKESLNGGTPVSITKDGIYNILAVNHQGKYGALNIQTTAGSGVRCSEKGASALNARGSGINIHSRGYGDPNLIIFVDDALGEIGLGIAQINFDSVFTPMPAKNMGNFLCSACGAENDLYCVHMYFLLLFNPFTNVGNAVSQRFVCERTGKCLLNVRKHIGQHRANVTPNYTLIVRVLVDIQKMNLRLFHNRLIDLKQRELLRCSSQAITANPSAAVNNLRFFQKCKYLADITGIRADAFSHLFRADRGWGF